MNEQPGSSNLIDFDKKPNKPLEYKFPNPVTRSNFASTIVTSFRISMAEERRQILYFELLKAHTGFDYITSLDNFLTKGGWNAFSQEEQELFMQGFDSVKAHSTKFDGKLLQDFHTDPATELEVQLRLLVNEQANYRRVLPAFETKYGPLVTQSQGEFIANLNQSYPMRNSKQGAI